LNAWLGAPVGFCTSMTAGRERQPECSAGRTPQPLIAGSRLLGGFRVANRTGQQAHDGVMQPMSCTQPAETASRQCTCCCCQPPLDLLVRAAVGWATVLSGSDRALGGSQCLHQGICLLGRTCLREGLVHASGQRSPKGKCPS
jgi:hypothetical protein